MDSFVSHPTVAHTRPAVYFLFALGKVRTLSPLNLSSIIVPTSSGRRDGGFGGLSRISNEEAARFIPPWQ
jgi:hypothetical protein